MRAPESNTLYPVSLISNCTTGNVGNPKGLLSAGGEVTTFTRTSPAEPPLWPKGTIANASTYHASSTRNGGAQTYHPINAIDGDSTTFWKGDLSGVFPNILTVLALEMMDLPGITILSRGGGAPVDLVVEVLGDNGSWIMVGAVTKSKATRIQVPFVPSVRGHGVRVTIMQDQSLARGEPSVVNEIWPGLVDDPPLPPSVVVDFGKPVVGFLSISFAGASNNRPGIRLAFSEMIEYLTDVSDFTRSYNVSLNSPFRVGRIQ